MYDFLDQQVSALNRGGQFLLWSIRSWVMASGGKACVPQTLAPAFQRFGMIGGLSHFHSSMTLLSRDGPEKLQCGRLCFPLVNEDEAILLALFHTLSGLESDRVRQTLECLVTEDNVGLLLASLSAVTSRLAIAGLVPDCSVLRNVPRRL